MDISVHIYVYRYGLPPDTGGIGGQTKERISHPLELVK